MKYKEELVFANSLEASKFLKNLVPRPIFKREPSTELLFFRRESGQIQLSVFKKLENVNLLTA